VLTKARLSIIYEVTRILCISSQHPQIIPLFTPYIRLFPSIIQTFCSLANSPSKCYVNFSCCQVVTWCQYSFLYSIPFSMEPVLWLHVWHAVSLSTLMVQLTKSPKLPLLAQPWLISTPENLIPLSIRCEIVKSWAWRHLCDFFFA
jgi:hypothetical protein